MYWLPPSPFRVLHRGSLPTFDMFQMDIQNGSVGQWCLVLWLDLNTGGEETIGKKENISGKVS